MVGHRQRPQLGVVPDMSLHLLRGMPPQINGRDIDFPMFRRMVRMWGPDHEFGSWTRRSPTRIKELEGGSIYYVVSREIRFRMPLLRIESVAEFQPDVPVDPKFANHVSLTCSCEIIMVEPRPVKYMRGWRYLEEKGDYIQSYPRGLKMRGNILYS